MEAKNTMKDKDLVVVYISYDKIDLIQLNGSDAKAAYNCKFGRFSHSSFIGKPYGTQIWSSDRKGFVHALRPTSQLITETLSHRTEVIYAPDIPFIVSSLELHSGCTVVESGTGSGSLSASIAHAVLPKGHLFTFEYNKLRAEEVAKDFKKYGLESVVTVTHRDVVEEGFMLPGLERSAHGVFLDLPTPWKVIEHATKVLRDYGKLCSFSPSIEQVQKSTEAMSALGFVDIKTYECLSRHFDEKTVEFPQLFETEKKQEYRMKRKLGYFEKQTEVACLRSDDRGHTGYITIGVYAV
eukprot:TRINITY_DN15027_c0_g1_i1.p1 TRINITY_DN15027_c0_g1~~TRINITY_DN15027_c0_g1_i1.p1  ORF type:complete len:296 (-),score=73.05 TRINITY_DN15027_c0_g1_i1:66-953(-)